LLSLEPSTGACSRRDHPALELCENPDHLPHGGAHRVVGVVSMDFSAVNREHRATVVPDMREGCLLDAQGTREPIQAVDNQPFGVVILDRREGTGEGWPVDN
jgi:hypothetical protein